jgi:hypothetical protein
MVDAHRYRAQLMPTSPQQYESPLGEADGRDSSLPLYVMYSKITQQRDNKEAENGQRYVDGLLVFVSTLVSSQ